MAAPRFTGLLIPTDGPPAQWFASSPVKGITTALGSKIHGGSHIGHGLVLWGHPGSVGETNWTGSMLLTMNRGLESWVFGQVVITAVKDGQPVPMTKKQHGLIAIDLLIVAEIEAVEASL